MFLPEEILEIKYQTKMSRETLTLGLFVKIKHSYLENEGQIIVFKEKTILYGDIL